MMQTAGGGVNGPLPMQIGKYELREEIGRGACGVVYKGFDPFVQRDVALKFSLHDLDLRQNLAHERAFFAEARAAGMLQHPHIVALHDAGVEGEISYIVMEFIDGATLQPLCRPDAPRPSLAEVLDIVHKCADALDYAHGKGVLHRDIKPSNIMLTRSGVPKLMDFSIAEISPGGRAGTQGGQSVLGSPLYMSPEQITRAALGPASDLYSLGAVMFQLLVGAAPFNDPELPLLFRAIRNRPAPNVRALRPDIPQAVADVVSRLLLKEPEQRFASGRELASCIGRLFDQLGLSDKPVTPRESRDSLRRLRFFATFSDEQINEILGASQMVSYGDGDVLMREGELDSSFFIIALGAAEVHKNGKRLHQLDKGDCVGEIGFLTTTRRTATVTALGRVLALKINASLLDQMSRDCQLRFYKVFTETLIYRLSVTSARLSALS